jgi:hypothetical protein
VEKEITFSALESRQGIPGDAFIAKISLVIHLK